ncbi:MAG: superfamily II DNA or RNA helicase [Phenylobacterium sp.]|jgi:superfamily II DNA or RNA helicase
MDDQHHHLNLISAPTKNTVNNMPETTSKTANNFTFNYDAEQLLTLTSEKIYRAGLYYFREDRVIEHFLEFHQDQAHLMARVEGSDPNMPYDVELTHDKQGNLETLCDCLSNFSEHDDDPICKHAIATLLTYADTNPQDPEQQQFLSAKETAIKDRVKRGQSEVRAEHLIGHAIFGIWRATSLISATHRPQIYTVQIRSLNKRINYCTCPDLTNNQLGTCKHIEAVLHQINKNLPSEQSSDLSQQLSQQQPPFVYLDFTHRNASLQILQTTDKQIKIQRTTAIDATLAELINRYFDAQGLFSGQLPGDFYSFCDAVYGNDNIVIGEDAKVAVQRIVDEQSQQLFAHKVTQQMMLSDGKLPGINATLYPYQIEGAAFLAANGRALLADDMGLGKTLQAIAAASWLTQQADVKRICIVCPASLKHQWAREIEKFTGLSSQIIQGGPDERQAQYHQDKTFFVLNYELVMRDLTVINATLKPDLLILDEAQRIKNWRTKVATSIKLIHTRYAFVLTGTPLENRLEDLYSLMQVVDQRILGPLWRYLRDYHISDEKGKVLGYRNLSALRNCISGKMLRRNRSIVAAQLPARTTVRLDITLSEKQQELHGSAMSAASRYANIAKKRPLTPSESNKLMAALQQARMACDAAGLVDKVTVGSPKLRELKTLVEEVCIDNGRKMVVFSQWRGMTNMVQSMLKPMGVGCVHLNGSIPSNKRGALMDTFKNDDSVSVFISTDAGGTGLNLQSASVLVNLDIPWNPAVLEQRNARIHRLGQSNQVQIVLMIAEDSYEERVFQLVNNKQDLFDNVIDPQGSEDVIGISKKSLTAVINDLTDEQEDTQPEPSDNPNNSDSLPLPPLKDEEEKLKNQSTDATQQITLPSGLASEADEQIKTGLLKIQQYYGQRIEQIMAKGGGLLIILNALDDDDDTFIQTLGLTIPIALIDLKTIRQLQGLGINTLGDDVQSIELPPASIIPTLSVWHQQASEKLIAAQTLLDQQIESGANLTSAVVELLCSAIASALTDKAQLNQIMPTEQIPVWLYSTALSEALLNMEEINLISRVIGLRLANPVPDNLLIQALTDVQGLLLGFNSVV